MARDLKWVHALKVKPIDAIHIASAIDRKCTAFITTDGPVTDLSEKLKEFGLVVCKADAIAEQLPDKYRQLPLGNKRGKAKEQKAA